MVRQGDIIKLSFNPQKGHEQAGYRPAVVVSNDFFNVHCAMTLLCPITNTNNKYPLHVPLDERTETTGVVLCEHIKSFDLESRPYSFVERMPEDLLEEVLDILAGEIKKE